MKLKFFILSVVSVIITACQYPVHSGTSVTEKQIEELSGKAFTKSEVEEKLGTPNIVPDYSPNNWYYVHRNMTKRAFFMPVIKNQRVVKLTFNNDRLSAIEAIDDEHDNDVKVVKEFIRTKGTELNPFQEYVKNFGRFSKTKKKASRR